MQTDRSDDVVARVVAWHNRHPLATRITANQVHSVGVVSLPFAVQGAVLQAVADVPQAPDAGESTAPGVPVAEQATVDLSDAAVNAATPADVTVTTAAPADHAGPPPMPAVLAQLPPRPARWNLPARWRARAAWRALFSEDFMAPLRPGRIASWAALHGVSKRPLEATAPQRDVVLDPARRRSADSAPEVPLFVLTAAIGVDDQRLRVLLAPEGTAVLGQRHHSRPRMAALAGGSLATLALLVGAGLWQTQHRVQAAAPAAATASAVVAQGASAPAASAPAAMAAASVPAAAPAASGPLADAPADHAQAPAEPPSQVATHASTHSPTVTDVVDAEPQATAAEATPRTAGARPRRGRVDVPPLVAKLDDAQRHDLRLAGRALRGEPAHPVHARAWALVTQPLSNRRQSERVAAQLHAVALLQPMPMRAELMQAEGGWRAVFWPFPTERDAEKVRLALADKGLRTQIVEF